MFAKLHIAEGSPFCISPGLDVLRAAAGAVTVQTFSSVTADSNVSTAISEPAVAAAAGQMEV